MTCHNYGNLTICTPTYTETKVRILKCPTCKRRRRFCCQFEDWYGWAETCTGCGDAWQDGEMFERPFARGWRAENIAAAKAILKEAKRVARRRGRRHGKS